MKYIAECVMYNRQQCLQYRLEIINAQRNGTISVRSPI